MKKKMWMQSISILLVLAVCAGCLTSCGKKSGNGGEGTTVPGEELTASQQQYTYRPGSVTKSETVFVNLNSGGGTRSIVVSDWLHTDKAGVRVDDVSDSTSIINVKGLETPLTDGENLVWNMSSTDLYYRGFGQKPLPVEFEITYALDGSPISSEELAGKSGRINMEIQVKNKVSQQQKIDGKTVTVYCPFLVIGGMILPDARFTDVNVQGGKIIADGSKQAALFVSIPGMRDSLGIDELNIDNLYGFSFPESFTLTAQTEDFSLSNLYFAVLPLSALGFGNMISQNLEEFDRALNDLTDMVDAIYDMGAGKLLNILTGSSDNISSLIDAVGDAQQLYQKNRALIAVASQFLTQENMASLSALLRDLEGMDTEALSQLLSDPAVMDVIKSAGSLDVEKYSELLNNPLLKSLFSDLSGIMGDVSDAMPALQKFSESVSEEEMQKLLQDVNALLPAIQELSRQMQDPEVQACVDALPETVSQLKTLASALEENRELLNEVSKLATKENMNKFESMLSHINREDLSALLAFAGVSTELAEKMVPRLDQVLKMGSQYTIYSKAPKGMNTAVMFVYQTPGI